MPREDGSALGLGAEEHLHETLGDVLADTWPTSRNGQRNSQSQQPMQQSAATAGTTILRTCADRRKPSNTCPIACRRSDGTIPTLGPDQRPIETDPTPKRPTQKTSQHHHAPAIHNNKNSPTLNRCSLSSVDPNATVSWVAGGASIHLTSFLFFFLRVVV